MMNSPTPAHPFFPQSLLIENYVPSQYSVAQILGPFFLGIAIVLTTSIYLIRNRKVSLSSSQSSSHAVFLWFIMCGFIHTGIEGYYAANSVTIAGQSTYMAAMWKEYALSDSRYMTIDPFVWMMESITAFGWGPLSFYTAYLIYTDSPARHLFQFAISFGQFYGDVLYYATTLVEGGIHSSPNPFHFYFYFVFMNSFWIVIPLLVMISSGQKISEALQGLQQKEKDLGRKQAINKIQKVSSKNKEE